MTVLYGRKGAKPFYNLEDCGRADLNWLNDAAEHLSHFSFVGLHDSYAADTRVLGEVMGGVDVVAPREARIDSQAEIRELANDPRVTFDLVKNNLYDMALYESIKLKRENSKMNKLVSGE